MPKLVRLLIIVPTLLVILFGIMAFGATPSAHAASYGSPNQTCGPCSFLYVTNSRLNGTLTTNEILLALGPGTSGSISQSVTWQNSWNASINGGGTLNSQTVSSGLGWSVSIGGSDTVTCSANNPNNHDITLAFQDVYNVYKFDVYLHQPLANPIYEGSGFANQFQHHRCAIV